MNLPKQKVFCIGFQKTGTSSMRDALKRLGYNVAGVFGRDLPLEDLRLSFVDRGLRIAEEVDAVEDMPWPLMYRELDENFPEAKFILTVRQTERWYGSISRHFGSADLKKVENGECVLQQLTYGEDAPAPVGHEERYRHVYEEHNREVKEYFSAQPGKLLVMSLEDGDGWKKLCSFLGISKVPDGHFVHTNSWSERRKLSHRVRARLRRLGLPVAVMDG